MNKLSSSPDLIARYSPLGSFVHQDFAPRPTFRGVAMQCFNSLLRDKYPNLNVGDDTPLWIAEPFTVTRQGQPPRYRFMALVEVLIQGYINAEPVHLIQGFHCLTTDSDTSLRTALPVDMGEVQQRLNDCAEVLMQAYQQALAQFWSEATERGLSPVQWLQQVLQGSLSAVIAQPDSLLVLPDDHAAALAVVANFPSAAARSKMAEETPLHAYLINIQCIEATQTQRFKLPGVALITRQMPDRLLVLSYSLAQGVEVFDSLQQFGVALIERVQDTLAGPSFTWSLEEPEGNFFTGLALTLLDQQLRQLTLTGQRAQTEHWSVGLLAQTLETQSAMFTFFTPPERAELDRVVATLPAWLKHASAQDLMAYSTLMAAQATGQQPHGETFMDGIVSLPAFAAQVLNARIRLDYPRAAVEASRIDIHDVSIESLELGLLTEEVIPLPEFALMYVGGKPSGLMSLSAHDQQPLPVWLTSAYLKNVLNELDIGSQYIALIKRLMVDDRVESARRLALYTQQLSVQLPLRALENKIRSHAGFTEAGWQMLNHLLNADSAHDPVHDRLCVRPLGFYAYEGAVPNYVANMFVLGPRDIRTGPFVLYRPFAGDALLEFATWQALLAAINQAGELQETVLAWLDDDARGLYADGGFERPHLEGVLLEGFLALLPRTPATLSTDRIIGGMYTAMFYANAQALITLSDRQTVSRSERRWILFKRYAWTVFNGLTFFVSGPLQKAAWLFQILISLENGLQARIDGDKQGAAQSVIDLLFTISLALLHQGMRFKTGASEPLRFKAPIDEPMMNLPEVEKPVPVDAPAISPLSQKMVSSINGDSASRFSTLDGWFSASRQLTASQRVSLEAFAVDVDLSLSTVIEVGPLKGVINYQGKSFVRLDGKVYRITRQADGLVVQDDKQPERLGPRLKTDGLGQWDLDLRLGLRGGGPKKRIQALRAQKNAKLGELALEEERLLGELKRRDAVLKISEQLLTANPERVAQFVDRYERDVGLWRATTLELVKVMGKANKLMPTERFEQKMQEVWPRVVLKLFRLQNYLEEALRVLPVTRLHADYLDGLKAALNGIQEGTSAPYEQWVAHLKQAEKLEERLFDNSVLESEAITQATLRPVTKESALVELMQRPDRQYFDRHWAVSYLETLSELLIRRDATDLLPEEQYAFDLFGQGTLIDTAWSQLYMPREGALFDPQHIELFDSAIEQYASADALCVSLEQLGSEHFRNEYLPSIRRVLEHLSGFAETQLEMVIRESESSSSEMDEPRPGPSSQMRVTGAKATPLNPAQKIIKTTKRQTLLGIKRESPTEPGDEIVDVTEGIDRMQVRSFRQLESGQWEEIGSARPSTVQVSHVKSLVRLEADARTLLGRLAKVIQDNRASAATSKIPIEIEEILAFKARSMEEVGKQIEQVVMATPADSPTLTEARRTVVLALSQDLAMGARDLRVEGKSLRIQIIKRLPPTGPNVDYLKTQGEITIASEGARRHLSRGQRKDYLQEYAIRDKDGKVLWFAHFHYPALDTPAAAFDVAHLKTAEQRTLSEQALYARAKTAHAYIEVYRAKVDKALAQRLFLSTP